MSGTFRLADLAAARNRQGAPSGPPQATTVFGQPHQLAYITPDEAYILRNRGGGLAPQGGQLTQSGVPAFYDSNDVNAGDTRGSDVGDRAGSPSTGESGQSDQYGGGGYSNDPYDTRASDVADRAGSPSTGESGASDNYGGPGYDAGYFGDQANYGGGGDVSGGGGGSEGNQPYYAPPSTPAAPAAPPGPTPEELAAREAKRIKDLQDEAERRVRAKYDSSLGATWRQSLADAFSADAQANLENTYGTSRATLLSALKDSGYLATPLATARLSGIDKQKLSEAGKIPGVRDARLTDYDARRNASLVETIRQAREGADPDKADLLADAAINAYNTDLGQRPGATYAPSISADSGIISPVVTAQNASAADVFRNAMLRASDTGAASRVG